VAVKFQVTPRALQAAMSFHLNTLDDPAGLVLAREEHGKNSYFRYEGKTGDERNFTVQKVLLYQQNHLLK